MNQKKQTKENTKEESTKELSNVLEDINGDASQSINVLNEFISNPNRANLEKIKSTLSHIINISNLTKEAMSQCQENHNTLNTKMLKAEEKANKLHSEIENYKNEFEGLRKRITEELKLNEAKKLWEDKSNSANKSYIFSTFIVFTLLLMPILMIWIYFDDIISILKKVGDFSDTKNIDSSIIVATSFSRLLIITMPAMLYIWLIRIVVRFNVRSLLLKDDADQRNTMLATYMHLTELNKADVTERPLILEALFRRAPGHGPETVETPNLTDILRLSDHKK